MADAAAERVALVTGATGFVGGALTRRLLAEGWSVHIVVRPQSNLRRLHDLGERITVHVYDGTVESLAAAALEIRGNIVVFHLASLFLAAHTPQDITPLIAGNILFGTHLVEAMVAGRALHMVTTGTFWQHYGNADYSPVCLYAATKHAFEAVLRYYCEATPLKVVKLVLYDIYGPGDERPKLFHFLRNAAEQQRPCEMSPGEQLIDLVYIDDVVDAFLRAADRFQDPAVQPWEEYAVSSGTPMKLKEVARVYASVINRPLLLTWGGRPYRTREVMVPWNRGVSVPGWKPKTGIVEGIHNMERSLGIYRP
jgi:nucleoside-diphosphate-sugar epimerase